MCALGAVLQAHNLVAKYPLLLWACSDGSVLAALELDWEMKPVRAEKPQHVLEIIFMILHRKFDKGAEV